MIRLAISVEGETEEEFVKHVLVDRLRPHGIEPTPYLLKGDVRVPRLGGEMARLALSHDAVTSLVDFYGFRDKNHQENAEELEHRILTATRANQRVAPASLVFPYVQLHEFEALLFSDVSAFRTLLNLPDDVIARLQAIREQFQTPEHINDNFLTKPSKRIKDIIRQYNKKVHGPLLVEAIGLDKIRAECPRFNQWVEDLEALAM